ncbi:peptidase M23 [Microbacterium mangrovi]|uniref:Peptidase M23 n=1 Tax=Microbacterium mangrovi TaxID=1348253 RepID=A0A0B2A4L1_9MICO|nr:peptidoglycan DD-metalloendopeptidase family protein [Microbacterium mangrovi]KHK96542.1 peptidase M23 [Microbacterium mangrovi]
MLDEQHLNTTDCDCAPTPEERKRLWPAVTRRSALTLGAAGVVALGVTAAPHLPPAFATDYPSWGDVQRALNNQKAKAGEVSRIQSLIAGLKADVAAKQAAATQASDEYYAAQQAFFDAAQRAADLQAQADAQAVQAKDAASKAGKVAAELYRNGGGDSAALQLFLSGSASNADDLLARLGTMDDLLSSNRAVYDAAVVARDSAQNLTNQAKVARNERDRLQVEAQKKMKAAQAASDAAQVALDNQNAHLGDLQAQLAALQSTTAKTITQYKAGVIAAAKARAAAEARARAAAEAAARAAAANQGGGGGGGNDGGGGGWGNGSTGVGGHVLSNGWCRPSNGVQTSGYGPRTAVCNGSYCSSSFHYGVDLASYCGSAIFAAHSGTVVYAGYNGGYGNYIHIDNGDQYGTGYGHIRQGGIFVRVGQHVKAGQLIAAEGNTGHSFGCHLHFETYVNNYPVNPATFMAARGISV